MEQVSDQIHFELVNTESGPKNIITISGEKYNLTDIGIEGLRTFIVVEKQSTGQIRKIDFGPLTMEEE